MKRAPCALVTGAVQVTVTTVPFAPRSCAIACRWVLVVSPRWRKSQRRRRQSRVRWSAGVGFRNPDVGAEGSLISGVRPVLGPRYSANHRLFRRTRRSVRPIFAIESQIEPWFAPRDPGACDRQGFWNSRRRMMPKQGGSARRARRSRSRTPERSRLIANAKTLKRSVGTKSTLDNGSHRTPAVELRASQTKRRGAAVRHPQIACQVQRSLDNSAIDAWGRARQSQT